MPLELALTLIDARRRRTERRMATQAGASGAGAGAGKRTIDLGGGRQSVHYSGDAAAAAMRGLLAPSKAAFDAGRGGKPLGAAI